MDVIFFFFFHYFILLLLFFISSLPSFPTPLLDKNPRIQDWFQGYCIEDFIKLHLFIHSYAMAPEENLREPLFSFHYVGPELWTQLSILSTILVTQPWTSILPSLRHNHWKGGLPPCPVVGCWDLYPGLCGCWTRPLPTELWVLAFPKQTDKNKNPKLWLPH